jgi:hypothetical protein
MRRRSASICIVMRSAMIAGLNAEKWSRGVGEWLNTLTYKTRVAASLQHSILCYRVVTIGGDAMKLSMDLCV